MAKKTEEDKRIIEDREELQNIVNKFRTPVQIPKIGPKSEIKKEEIFSKEYKEYKEEEFISQHKNRYEKACEFSEQFGVKPSENKSVELKKAIEFTGLNVTPTGVFSLAVVSGSIVLMPAMAVVLLANIAVLMKVLVLTMPLFVYWQLATYPLQHANKVRMEAGKDLVIGVLYIIVYMKSVPNFENAVRYAANNTGGKLSRDLKKVLWEVEVGTYKTVEDAMQNYITKWKDYNKEFIESVQLIRESMSEGNQQKRDILLDRAIDILLRVTGEKTESYARGLETPVTVLHSLGILLPVMGMIVFPLLSIFLSEEIPLIGPYLLVGYNIILPAFVFFFIKQVFDKRPATHSATDISMHPKAVPLPKFRIDINSKTYFIDAWPIAFLTGFVTALPGIIYFIRTGGFKSGLVPNYFVSMMLSVDIIFGTAIGFAIYFYLTSFQKMTIQKDISDIEGEFEEALFALGNRMSGGTPLEYALNQALDDIKDLTISEMFTISLKNINRMNMTFKQSLFDEKYGALRFYPSQLIRTIMKSISEAVDKGTKATSTTMLTISRYLRSIRDVQNKIEDILSSTVSSMKFQAYILVPMISGVVVAVSQMILQLLINLGETFEQINAGSSGLGSEFQSPIGIFGAQTAVSSEFLQLIVGIYVIEILILLGIFMNRIEVGENKIRENDMIWRLLLGGVTIYIVVLIIVVTIFQPLIAGVTSGLGIAAA